MNAIRSIWHMGKIGKLSVAALLVVLSFVFLTGARKVQRYRAGNLHTVLTTYEITPDDLANEGCSRDNKGCDIFPPAYSSPRFMVVFDCDGEAHEGEISNYMYTSVEPGDKVLVYTYVNSAGVHELHRIQRVYYNHN